MYLMTDVVLTHIVPSPLNTHTSTTCDENPPEERGPRLRGAVGPASEADSEEMTQILADLDVIFDKK